MFMPLPQEERKYSFADYLTWPENERWEIVDGVPYMQAAPSPIHQEVLNNINVQFYNYLVGKPCKVYLAPFCVRLGDDAEQKHEDIKRVFEPDISIVCDKSKIDEKGCMGAPELIVEVLSPSSVRMDRVEKFNSYEEAGVKEYWLVEPQGKIVSVFVLQGNNRYGRPEIYTEDEKIAVSIFPDLVVDLSTVFPS